MIPARLCKEDDFSKNAEYMEIFQKGIFVSLNLYCPAFELYNQNVTISGSKNNMRQKYFEFQISRCDRGKSSKDGINHTCASDKEIDEYIQDLEVSVYTMSQIVDFTIYGSEPTFSIQKYLGSTLMDDKFVMVDDISLELNTVETEDDFFQLGQSMHWEYYQVAHHIRNKLFPTSFH